MKYKRTLLTLLASLLLQACGQSTAPLDPVKVSPPANAAMPCEDLEEIADTANMGELLQFTKYVVDEYTACALRHESLINAQ